MSGKTYEDEFSLEMAKAREGKSKATPWGSGYSKAPEILHGAWGMLLFKGPSAFYSTAAARLSSHGHRRAAGVGRIACTALAGWPAEAHAAACDARPAAGSCRGSSESVDAAAHTILLPCHVGYTKKVKGKTAEERLDMRAAMKWVLPLCQTPPAASTLLARPARPVWVLMALCALQGLLPCLCRSDKFCK
jgi:hypothetical protein